MLVPYKGPDAFPLVVKLINPTLGEILEVAKHIM